MVGAVLVQNTRWKNVEAAIRSLRSAECLTPEAISLQGLAGLGTLIRPAGCQSVKARRLKALADWVNDVGGIRRITRLSSSRLRKDLLSVHGIGSETADAILCFGFDRPTFIADRYARRWLGRMGVTPADVLISYERCRQFFGPQLENLQIDLADLHAAIVLHGQSVCGSMPSCTGCPIRSQCLHEEPEFDGRHSRAPKSKLPHRSGAKYLKDAMT
jgi:endonuclease-3 related protein